MRPWSGVCAHHPPRVTAHSQHVTSAPFSPSWGSSQSLLLGGLIRLLSPGLLSHSPVSGPSVRLVTLKQTQSHVTRAAFLDHTHHLLIHSQLRPERSPWALSPRLCLGALSLWSGPSNHVPCRVTRSSYHPWAGCLLCPGEASVVSGERNKRYP